MLIFNAIISMQTCARFLSVTLLHFFLLLSFCYAQENTTADSLINELNLASADTTRINILEQLFWERIFANPEEAKGYMEQARSLADNIPDSAYRAGIINIEGVYHWTQSDYASSLVSFRQALAIFEQIGARKRVSALLNNIGNVYESLGSYEEALDYQIRALRLKEEMELGPDRIANSYMNIGNIHVEMSNYDLAENFYLKVRTIGDSINNEELVNNANSNLAVVYGNLGDHNQSVRLYKGAVAYNRAHGLDVDLASALDGLGQEYYELNKLDSALIFYRESSEINQKTGNEDLLALNYRNIGEIMAKKKQYREAIDYLNKGLEISERLETRKDVMHDYRVLSATYKDMGNFEQALTYHEKYLDTYFEVFNEQKDQAISELQIRYDTEKKENEIRQQRERIKILNQEAQIEGLRRNLLIGTVIGILVIAALVVYSLRQKIRRKEAEQEKERNAYEEELNYKRRELTTHTLHLVQKNELLEELKDKIDSIRRKSPDHKKDLGRMVQLIKNDAVAEKDWENFKKYFQQVHQDFDQKLREQFNDLTSNEMRLAALMKMNLTTKEMATILNISPDSVNKARYRLRKKFNLSTDDNLSDFILAL